MTGVMYVQIKGAVHDLFKIMFVNSCKYKYTEHYILVQSAAEVHCKPPFLYWIIWYFQI